MVNIIKLWILSILSTLICVSCQPQKSEPSNYAQESAISSTTGVPTDSLAFYLPTQIRKDTQLVKLEIDQSSLEQFSMGLYYSKEPILYNYYLGHDIYRFSFLRGFKAPIYFILHKDGDNITLTTKALDRRPNLGPPSQKFVGDWKTGSWVSVLNDEFGDTIVKNARGSYTRKAYITYNKTIELTQKDWDDFEALLKECNYWNMTPFDTEEQLGNDRWLMEAHLKNKYWFVHMYSPMGAFKNAGDFLIRKSGITSEPMYTQEKK
ncbi:MAG: hypothetical protein IPM69_05855 [Ignavibacteria bacterium]|nr:hypothetical protein [Ignavibacteria bacterium]